MIADFLAFLCFGTYPESKFVLEADQILSWEDRQITMEVKYCSSYIWDKDKLKKLKADVSKDPWNSDK